MDGGAGGGVVVRSFFVLPTLTFNLFFLFFIFYAIFFCWSLLSVGATVLVEVGGA